MSWMGHNEYDEVREGDEHFNQIEGDFDRIMGTKDDGMLRVFETGATRDTSHGKYNYEGFLSPLVLKRYAQFMHKNRVQADGSFRDADNWQAGFPRQAYIDSGFRHFMSWWLHHDGHGELADEELEDALCALIFNAMGRLHEELLGRSIGE